ncbi:MAG: cytochrome c biogenesis protein CcdA [Crocinitomicaceae bacterium]|nr:cytochrome c biogenesis protein CcdA [Crocinitomicaceae bacterium]
MIKFLSLFLLVLFTISSNETFSQIQNPEDKVRSSIRLEQNDCDLTIIVDVDIIDGWHINSHVLPEESYAIASNIRLNKSSNYTVKKLIEPKPILEYDEDAEEMLSYHHHKFTLKRKVTSKSFKDYTLKGVFSFQTCDSIKCLPEHEVPFSFKVKKCGPEMELRVEETDTNATEVNKDTTEQSSDISDNNGAEKDESSSKNSNSKKEEEEGKSMWLIFILSFLSGFAALLTPCVFPMIPMTVSFFTKQSKSRAAGIRNAIIYGVSIILIYVILGTIVTSVFGYDALNALSTDVTFNLIFFVLLVVFAISFMGAFEIRLPSSWLNKADQASDKGGIIGIFFMALALALVSFSCTGPIVGTLLVESATVGGMAPFVGMFGFSLALALPFSLFAAFPGWMNSLPKSGGWLNTVKVVLGFLELAFAFKFLSNADLVVDAHLLERELFIAIWIGIFLTLSLYLFGFIRLPHDSPTENLSVGRSLLGISTLIFVIYLLPGMWGAPLNLISGFPPPSTYAESPFGVGGGSDASGAYIPGEDTHPGPHKLPLFDDFDKALAYSKKVGKPLFIDFTGKACVNCRKMENTVWGKPGVIEKLRNDVVIVSLYVDDKKDLPKKEHKTVEYAPGKYKKITQVGHKWSYFQQSRYKTNTQPYYRMLGPNGEDLSNGSADYEHHGSAKKFQKWLEAGLNAYKKIK